MISVCVATYQGSAFIECQLKSILKQLSSEDEVLISDDGSTDETVSIIKGIGDNRIKWAGIGGNLGVVKNFERSIRCAIGEYIFLSDQDDIWLPGKISACMDALKDYSLVVTDCEVVDEYLHQISPSFFELRKSGPGVCKNIIKNTYLGCCMAFRRDLLNLALPFPASVPMHDMWLGLLADMNLSVVFLPRQYILYRRHNKNLSPMVGDSKIGILKRVKYRIELMVLLLARQLCLRFRT